MQYMIPHCHNSLSCNHFVAATPASNPVEVPKEPEFVIFASYSHPPNMPMRHSVLKEMVSTECTVQKYPFIFCQ